MDTQCAGSAGFVLQASGHFWTLDLKENKQFFPIVRCSSYSCVYLNKKFILKF